jgi:chemotaxis protein methyltransferase CheR
MLRITGVAESELDEISALIEERSGIRFDRSRERFFSTRIAEYITAKKLENGAALMRTVLSSNAEYQLLLQSLLTHETSFFRYPDVFDAFKTHVLPQIQTKKIRRGLRSLRIWSAGCSTGEEPYSIAIVLASLPHLQTWDVEILATDISREALQHGVHAAYSKRRLANLSTEQIEANFTKVGTHFEVKPNLRKMISFVTMNLAQSLYVGRMDCIFCMNVLIYFAEQGRNQVIRNLYNSLEPGGYLFLGHSETIGTLPVPLERIVSGDCLMYRKPDNGASNLGNPA